MFIQYSILKALRNFRVTWKILVAIIIQDLAKLHLEANFWSKWQLILSNNGKPNVSFLSKFKIGIKVATKYGIVSVKQINY